MSASYIGINPNTMHGSMLKIALNGAEEDIESLKDILGAMALMIDGDGSQASHFALVTSKFGWASDAVSKAAYEELSSAIGKITTDASVSNVNAALNQLFNKFR